jgi:hypothetical protein
MKQVKLPHNLEYRDYQKPLRDYMREWGSFLGKRAVTKWHRRAGKDKTFFNLTVEAAIRDKGWYAYILPTYAQGRKIIWDSIDKDWLKFIDHIPKEALEWTNGTELKITLKNWSFIQILWSDRIDTIRGTNWKWVIFSEYAFQNPMVWDVLRPILAENGWWAIFNSTPNWDNHFKDLYETAKASDNWFSQSLSVEDTWVVSQEYIQKEREEGMTEEMIQQEYYVSFEVWSIGAYYADLMSTAKDEWRITKLPKLFNPVDVYFDLWRNDSTSIWFKQNDGLFYNFIHYYEDSSKHISKYFDYLDEYLAENSHQLGTIHFPHDSKNQHIEAEKSSWQYAADRYWNHKLKYIERTTSVQKDRDRVREMLPKCRFDIDSAKQWVKCLWNYRKKYDHIRKVYLDSHEHDWSSHWADAFRYFAVTQFTEVKITPRVSRVNMDRFR